MNVVPVTIGALAPTNDTLASLTWRDPARPDACNALDDVPEAVDAPRAEAAAKGVERQFAVELDMPVLDQVECLAFFAETVGCETVDHRGREAVVDLGHVDVLRTESGAPPPFRELVDAAVRGQSGVDVAPRVHAHAVDMAALHAGEHRSFRIAYADPRGGLSPSSCSEM